jgi:hypothetical protein
MGNQKRKTHPKEKGEKLFQNNEQKSLKKAKPSRESPPQNRKGEEKICTKTIKKNPPKK